jgi:hypothetical protein
MSTIPSLVSAIDERLVLARAEIEKLTRSRAALEHPAVANGGRAARARPVRAQVRAAARSPRTVRPGAPLTAERLERLLADQAAGLSARTIAAQAGADYKATLALMRQLEASGQMLREGDRRATVGRLITDEDGVAPARPNSPLSPALHRRVGVHRGPDRIPRAISSRTGSLSTKRACNPARAGYRDVAIAVARPRG